MNQNKFDMDKVNEMFGHESSNLIEKIQKDAGEQINKAVDGAFAEMIFNEGIADITGLNAEEIKNILKKQGYEVGIDRHADGSFELKLLKLVDSKKFIMKHTINGENI